MNVYHKYQKTDSVFVIIFRYNNFRIELEILSFPRERAAREGFNILLCHPYYRVGAYYLPIIYGIRRVK